MPSIIMPAGGSKIEWSPNPEAEKTEKTVADPQFDAIRNLPGIKAQAESLDLEMGEEIVDDEKVEAIGAFEKDEAKECPAEAAIQEVAKAAEEVKEVVEQAVDKVVEEAKEAVEVAKAGTEADKPADADEKKEGEEVAEIAVIVEDEPEIPGVIEGGDGKVEKETCAASDKGQFVRIAALSPQNRKDLVDYWKNGLGFAPEYVDAMVKDYEE